jgi:hypothetical protein
MPETDAAAIFAPNAREATELPVTGLRTCRAVQGEVSLQLAKLQRYGVVSRQWSAVQGYLERYPDLATVLPALCEQARREFKPSDELAIELYGDPEIKDDYLTLYIRQTRYEADIMARIERLSDTFSDRLEHASGYLLLTSDFSSPRGSDAL